MIPYITFSVFQCLLHCKPSQSSDLKQPPPFFISHFSAVWQPLSSALYGIVWGSLMGPEDQRWLRSLAWHLRERAVGLAGTISVLIVFITPKSCSSIFIDLDMQMTTVSLLSHSVSQSKSQGQYIFKQRGNGFCLMAGSRTCTQKREMNSCPHLCNHLPQSLSSQHLSKKKW